jgi:amino acid permease
MDYVRNKRSFSISILFVGVLILALIIGVANVMAGSIRLVFGGDSATNWIVGVLCFVVVVVACVVTRKRLHLLSSKLICRCRMR